MILEGDVGPQRCANRILVSGRYDEARRSLNVEVAKAFPGSK
jgi:hypothetical protein